MFMLSTLMTFHPKLQKTSQLAHFVVIELSTKIHSRRNKFALKPNPISADNKLRFVVQLNDDTNLSAQFCKMHSHILRSLNFFEW